MDIVEPLPLSLSPAPPEAPNTIHDASSPIDLVGGPFAVIESDPGVFTSLTRKLGVRNVELIELYDIEPWAVDHLNPHGLIFCFLWHRDAHRPADFDDPAAERVWFANQVSDDACASHAILNVLLNCPDIDIGEGLRTFKKETGLMSPVMKGLAVTNSPLLRHAHNSLARPADIRGALNSIATTTLTAASKAEKSNFRSDRDSKPPPTKRARTTGPSRRKDKDKGKVEEEREGTEDEAFHFIGYVPAHGKVWELDGLKSGPLEVGELPSLPLPSLAAHSPSNVSSRWMNVVRPALRMKMEKYGGAAEGGNNIRFSLLAVVDGVYEKASDDFQFLKRERKALERRMGSGWEAKVDPILLQSSTQIFDSSPASEARPFAGDFGERRMYRDKFILEMPEEELIPSWERCIKDAVRAHVAVEDELAKATSTYTDHVKRTFDYQPFLMALVERLNADGLLKPLLGLDDDGKKIRRGTNAKVKK